MRWGGKRKYSLKEWHAWFAWYPVWTIEYKWVWLETVNRRLENVQWYPKWEYSLCRM